MAKQSKVKLQPAPPAQPSEADGPGAIQQIPLDLLAEPEIPMRGSMDEASFLELKESMLQLGLLYPLIVFAKDGGYEVVDGHRRLLAARELKYLSLPCLIFRGEETAREAAKLHTMIVREALNTAEEAVYIVQLIDKYKLDEEGICKMMHRSPDYIGDRLRLLRQDKTIFTALRNKQISFATARELNKCEDENMRRYYLDAAIRSGCASRVVTEWIQNWRLGRATVDANPQVTAAPTPAPAGEVYWDHCELCGGDRDPGNLITIRVHKWEWEAFMREWERTAKGATA